MKPPFLWAAALALVVSTAIWSAGVFPAAAAERAQPNILYILCDDLGYGDVHCLNPDRGKIPTPHLDQLAKEGMVFTDAHSGSSVCTPTRYGILTGRYAWRTRLQRGVLNGFSAPLIAADRLTVPKLLKQHGYETACLGKWHLGMNIPLRSVTESPAPDQIEAAKSILDAPTTRGFDSFFGISASLDMPPFAFIANDRFTEAPSTTKKFLRDGPAAPGFEAVDVLPTLTRKAVEHLSARKRPEKPFFLYLAFASPHTPIVPSEQWQGKSGLTAYADFVMQTDAAIGDVLAALEQAHLTTNTLVMFASDNGCSPQAGVEQLEKLGHFPSARLRGYKSDIWDGGHRIPFVVRWPGVVKPGSTCAQLTCLTDLMATCADILRVKLPDNAGEDSVSILPLLRGEDNPVRQSVVHHSIDGRFAIRETKWKLEFCPGSGGWSKPTDAQAKRQDLPATQLYDMGSDLGEMKNVQGEFPEVVRRLTRSLEALIANGRSTPGPAQRNDVAVELPKAGSTL